jgi:hypothetical protein
MNTLTGWDDVTNLVPASAVPVSEPGSSVVFALALAGIILLRPRAVRT